MIRLYSLLLALALLMLPPTLAGATEAADSASRTLVVYFSMPEDLDISGVDAIGGASIVVRDGEKLGNLQFTAQIAARETGAGLFRLETVVPYPLDHDPLVDYAAQEQDEQARPALVALPDLSQVDTILLGYPNWWGDLPMPLYTFLEQVDLSGKNVIPFTIHGGSGLGDTVRTIAALQPNAIIGDNTLSISRNNVASSEEAIAAWADSLGLTGSNAQAD